jgi:dephospho-CoA kinase
VQLQRLIEQRGMDEATARQRMGMQSPQAAKVNQADRVINNNDTPSALFARLDEIWEALQVAYPKRMAHLSTPAADPAGPDARPAPGVSHV